MEIFRVYRSLCATRDLKFLDLGIVIVIVVVKVIGVVEIKRQEDKR